MAPSTNQQQGESTCTLDSHFRTEDEFLQTEDLDSGDLLDFCRKKKRKRGRPSTVSRYPQLVQIVKEFIEQNRTCIFWFLLNIFGHFEGDLAKTRPKFFPKSKIPKIIKTSSVLHSKLDLSCFAVWGSKSCLHFLISGIIFRCWIWIRCQFSYFPFKIFFDIAHKVPSWLPDVL